MKIYYTTTEDESPESPIVEVFISEFEKNNFAGPIEAILDTGADLTCLPRGAVVKLLGDIYYERESVAGIGGAPFNSKIYIVDLKINKCIIPKVRVAEIADDIGIVGRDVLNQYHICFHGPESFAKVYSNLC
jgi:predicted aspartyl protease